MEMFYSIQGEGYNTGKAASFVRIGGCDVGCKWCDVKESWNASLHPLTPVEKVIENVMSNPARAVVITGGEPLMYNLDVLCHKLKENQIRHFSGNIRSISLEWFFRLDLCLTQSAG
jgi:7-carboxy-7-deazaguanine synthase